MHLRSDSVKHDIPIGRESLTSSHTTGAEATEDEKKVFEEWLLERFRIKDQQMELFHQKGKLHDGEFVDIPVRLRNLKELVGLLASILLGAWLGRWTILFLWRVLVG